MSERPSPHPYLLALTGSLWPSSMKRAAEHEADRLRSEVLGD